MTSLAAAPGGDIWCTTGDGLYRLRAGRLEPYALPGSEGVLETQLYDLFRFPDGRLQLLDMDGHIIGLGLEG